MRLSLPTFSNQDQHLLSHRLRGFDKRESSIEGLRLAFMSKVRHIEIDIRVTKDRELIIAHDPFLLTPSGPLFYHEHTLEHLRARDPQLTTLDSFLQQFSALAQGNPKCKLHIDIKTSGQEEIIVDTVKKYLDTEDFVLISWVPEILARLADILPEAKLAFSHVVIESAIVYSSLKILKKLLDVALLRGVLSRVSPRIFRLVDTLDMRTTDLFAPMGSNIGKTTVCVLRSRVPSSIMEAFGESLDYVCVPRFLLNRSLMQHYRALRLKVAAFPYTSIAGAERDIARHGIHLAYMDIKF